MFGALAGIVHVDGAGERLGQYLLPPGDSISEPVFVARGEDAAEGEGWLLTVVWRAHENRSDLAVFNATDKQSTLVTFQARSVTLRIIPGSGCLQWMFRSKEA